MMNKIWAVGVMLFILNAPAWAAAQEGVQGEGLIDSVGRIFNPAGSSSAELVSLEVRVAQFETDQQASGAIAPWFDFMKTGDFYRYDVSGILPIASERVADETQAQIGTVPFETDSTVTLDVAFVVVRDANKLLLFTGWSDYSGIEDRLLLVAKRTLGIEPLEFSPVPGIPYTEGGLWDDLPRIEHLPQGLTWTEDFSPCVGVIGASPCESETVPSPDPTVTASPVSSTGAVPPLMFNLVIRVGDRYLLDQTSCDTKGFYSGIGTGGHVFILNSATEEVLFSAFLSRGTSENDGCSWTVAVLRLAATERYHVTLGDKHLHWFDYEDLIGLPEAEIRLGF